MTDIAPHRESFPIMVKRIEDAQLHLRPSDPLSQFFDDIIVLMKEADEFLPKA